MLRIGMRSTVTAPCLVRFASSKQDPLSILSSMTKQGSEKAAQEAVSKSDSFYSFMGESSTKSISQGAVDAFEFAQRLPVADKMAGRSVLVRKSANINRSVSQFNTLVRSNSLKDIWYDQRDYTKPKKRRLEKRIANKKKRFDAGIAELFRIVKDAVRKGY